MEDTEVNHICLLNPQGNFDPDNSYWTKHPDFGGQLVYVRELSLALAEYGVKVDIITRQINDENWPEFSKKIDKYPESENVRIIRIPFDGDRFLNKEDLWPYINEYVQGIIDFYEKENSFPELAVSHYGTGGISGLLLKLKKNLPYIFTGHSLGAEKMEKFGINKFNFTEYNTKYNFHRRIIAERLSIKYSDAIITSTNLEKEEIYKQSIYEDIIDENKFMITPPGVNTDIFNGEYSKDIKQKLNKIFKRNLNEDRIKLPFILINSRLTKKKNHIKLVKAFAENEKLQKEANLAVSLRNVDDPFKDYSNLADEEKNILDQIMKLIYNNNCSDKVTMFSIDNQKELAESYSYFAELNSVFVLPSIYETFGLTLIEAMVSGLPAVVTKNGGPAEVVQQGKYGILIDPEDSENIADGLLELLTDNKKWNRFHKSGIKYISKKFSWKNTAEDYLNLIDKILSDKPDFDIDEYDIPDYYTVPDSKNDSRLLDRFLRIWKNS
ncbi:MAG: glycosyltransferase [Bacillota bacterium]